MSQSDDIKSDLAQLKDQMSKVIESQTKITEDIKMIFADISIFENMILKLVQGEETDQTWERTKIH